MEAVERLELKAELLREIDRIREQKADTQDVKVLATEFSRMQLDNSERNRAMRDSVADVERAVKALAALVAEQPGANRGGRFSLREFDPRILVIAGLAVGAAGGKFAETLLTGGL